MWILFRYVNFIIIEVMKQKNKLNQQSNTFQRQNQEGESLELTSILDTWKEEKKEEVQVDNKEEMILEQRMILKDQERKLLQIQEETHLGTEETLTEEDIVREVKATEDEMMVKGMIIEDSVEIIVKETIEEEIMVRREENTEITENKDRREITVDNRVNNKMQQKMEMNIDRLIVVKLY